MQVVARTVFPFIDRTMQELKIVFLGTSSARPTPKRNTAALALVYGGETILFDCGEGTQIQIMKSEVRASRFRAICLTHFHGDHVNGLPGLIGTMGLNGRRDPLELVAPRGTDRWLATLRQLGILNPSFRLGLIDHRGENADSDIVLRGANWRVRSCAADHRVPCVAFRFEEDDLPGRFDLDAARALGIPAGPLYGRLQRGESVELPDGRVINSEEVMGTTRRGRSVVYITDTRPTDALVSFAEGADLLIHEATYSDDEAAMAEERYHSTARQAAQVARDAGVAQLYLTHFSTRFAATSPLVAEARAVFPATKAAREFREIVLPVPA